MKTQKFLRQRKFLTLLPVLVLPFITGFFWALGGGQGQANSHGGTLMEGLNTQLPEVQLSGEQNLDKLSLYKKAERDLVKLNDARKRDPYFLKHGLHENESEHDQASLQEIADFSSLESNDSNNSSRAVNDGYTDPNEEKVNKKIAQIHQAMKAQSPTSAKYAFTLEGRQTPDGKLGKDIDRLEHMMESMSAPPEQDPEMQQIESILEKILEIQHPEKVRDQLKASSLKHRNRVFPASNSSLILDQTGLQLNSFYGLIDGQSFQVPIADNAIQAAIHSTQTVLSGSQVKIRLLSDVFISGYLIGKGKVIYGVCTLNNQRLQVKINSIRHQNSVLPVDLNVYDAGGQPGLYIPQAIGQQASGKGAQHMSRALDFGTLDSSLAAQALDAGIEVSKDLVRKGTRKIKATLKADFPILLIDNNSDSSTL